MLCGEAARVAGGAGRGHSSPVRGRSPPAWVVVATDRDAYPWLRFLADDPSYYHAWAQDYYEKDIDAHGVRRVYQDHDVTDEVIAMLNPEASRATVESDLSEILG